MSFQRKPPKDRTPKDGAAKDEGPRRYSSFKRKQPGESKSGFGAKLRPEAGQSAKTNSNFGAPKKVGRDVDARKSMKVLRALEIARAEAIANGADLSAWETEFMGSLETRIDTYGSAFRDPTKGALEEPISNMQRVKLKEIQAKAIGNEKKPGFGRARKRAKKISVATAKSEER